jgi:hypothetical protein
VTYGEAQASAFGGWSFQGFNYSLYEVSLPTIVCTAYTNDGNTVPVSPPPFQLGIIMPDGAHHVLKLYGQTDTYGNGTYWFDPQSGEDPCTSQTLASPLTYYTTDGSYIRVSVNTSNPGAYPAGGPYTIYLPNGMEISSAGWGTWASGQPFAATSGNSTIRDRNGNQVKVTLNANNTTTLTDDLGRTVTVGNSAVTQTGFGGSPLSWTLGNYFSVETGAACQTPGVYGCGKFPAGGPQFLQVPSDTGTLQYQFGYDPTSGELTSVTLPSGATTSYTYGGGSYATTVGLTLFYSTVVTGKQVTWLDQSDGGSTKRSETWGYNYGCPAGPPCTTTITAPDGGAHTTSFYGASPLAAMVTKETLPDGSATETMYEQNPAFYEAAISAGGTDSANPFVALVVHTVASNGQPTLAAVEQRMIDQNGNLASDTEYDWIPYAQLTHDTCAARRTPTCPRCRWRPTALARPTSRADTRPDIGIRRLLYCAAC